MGPGKSVGFGLGIGVAVGSNRDVGVGIITVGAGSTVDGEFDLVASGVNSLGLGMVVTQPADSSNSAVMASDAERILVMT